MKKLAFIVLFVFGFIANTLAQGFVEHTVKEGETVAAIVQQYEVSPYELYELNPDAKEGIVAGAVLVFLRNKNYPYDPTLVDMKRYKVGKKETLKEIAFNNSVTEADIKKYNPELYSEKIKKGKTIKIPVFDASLLVGDSSKVVVKPKEIKHIVKTKETKYGIAHQYEITIAELEELNPHIVDGLKVGQLLTIKSVKEENIEATTVSIKSNLYAFYEVQPKEGFFRLSKKLGVSKDSLIALNPQLEEGIKLGMILKYPKANISTLKRPSYNLIDSIINKETRNITLLLPFRMNNIIHTDSTSNMKKLLVRKNNAMNKSLDFYSGVLMALDSVKQVGISTRLNVIDTEYSGDVKANIKRIEQVLNREFVENEVVIGPLVSANVITAAKVLNSKNIPLIAPFGLREDFASENLYQTETSEASQRKAMITYLKHYAKGKKVIIVADDKRRVVKNKKETAVTDDKMKAVKDELISQFPEAKLVIPRKGGLLIPKDFVNVIEEGKENVVIVEGVDKNVISTVTSVIETFTKKNKISMFTTSSQKWFELKGVKNRLKAKLNYHYPSATKPAELDSDNAFVVKYEDTYGKLPNKYAMRGFDVALDVLLRQGVANTLEDGVLQIGETKYLDAKFNYKRNVKGGYINDSVYILRYTPEFSLEEVIIENKTEEITTEE
ncbi:LysM peptidoglycan-binding domain-containing protein [Pseudofulvibacter geojedonensis]|uniref:LysM peptidoglycan-binding domain-containing protein n=1 Tax=Pseudofulvibacter geojedonensis TaxID=1123758 RepID=A0ABW3I5I6_9FLAO